MIQTANETVLNALQTKEGKEAIEKTKRAIANASKKGDSGVRVFYYDAPSSVHHNIASYLHSKGYAVAIGERNDLFIDWGKCD